MFPTSHLVDSHYSVSLSLSLFLSFSLSLFLHSNPTLSLPGSQSGAVLALSRLLYEFNEELPVDFVLALVQTVVLLLQEKVCVVACCCVLGCFLNC